MKTDESPPLWFNSLLSGKINIPMNDNHEKIIKDIGYGNSNHHKKHTAFFKFKTQKNDFDFIEKKTVNVDSQKEKITKILAKSINTIKGKYSDDPKKIETKMKSVTTKLSKKLTNINTVTKCKQYIIYPTKEQLDKLQIWFKECKYVYDKCSEKYKTNPEIFEDSYMSIKQIIFKELYTNGDKKTPYDVLTDEVRIFCSNLKSCKTNLENGNINKFDIGEKRTQLGQCIFIPKTAVKKGSIYCNTLKKMKGLESVELNDLKNDCRLIYDAKLNRYSLLVPVNIPTKVIENRQPVVALDPGEKIFIAYYGLNEFGQLGINMRYEILGEQAKIKKFQKLLDKKINRRGKQMSKQNLKKIQKKINKCYSKIRNITKELHNKIAYFLCTNYDRILIPEFKTQNMVKNEKVGVGKKKVTEKFVTEGKEAGKAELKIYNKKKRLNKKVKFTLGMLSHYRFRQHLSNKCAEYGCDLKVITEEHTSITCTKCGIRSSVYNKREKNCTVCGYKIDRDVNGSRNILLKNITEVLKEEKTDKIIKETDIESSSEPVKEDVIIKPLKTIKGKIVIVKGTKTEKIIDETKNKLNSEIEIDPVIKDNIVKPIKEVKRGRTIIVKGIKTGKTKGGNAEGLDNPLGM